MVPALVLPLALLIKAVLGAMPQLELVEWELLVWRSASLVDSMIRPAQASGPRPLWDLVRESLMDPNRGSTNTLVTDMNMRVIHAILEHRPRCLISLPALT